LKRINLGFRHGQNCTEEDVVHIAIQAISNAVTAEPLRYVQAEIFSLRFALSLEQTAKAIGLFIGWASKQRTNSFKEKPYATAPFQRVGAAQTKLHTKKKRLLHSSRFWRKYARKVPLWSAKSSITLMMRCDGRLFTRCCSAMIGGSWPRTRAIEKVIFWLRKGGKKSVSKRSTASTKNRGASLSG
jgi:hypothetical protein